MGVQLEHSNKSESTYFFNSLSDSESTLSNNCGRKRKHKKSCFWNSSYHLAGFLISLTCAIVIGSTMIVEDSINIYVLTQLPISEGSKRMSDWISGEPPLVYKIYIFNLTNPQAFQNGDRPRVEEIGPFAYEVNERREQVRYQGSHVIFTPKPLFKFRPDLSVGDENLKIITFNIPLVNAGEMTKGLVKSKALDIIKQTYQFESLQTLTIKELLWGHKSKVLDWAKSIKDIPYPYDYFALFAGRNDTLQFETIIDSGLSDISQLNQVLYYGGPVPTTGCHAPRGTDGSGFGPGVEKTQTLYIYNGQLCRSLPLTFKEETFKENGLRSYTFALPEDVFSYSSADWYDEDEKISSNFKGNSKFNYNEQFMSSYVSANKVTLEDSLPKWKKFYGENNKCFCHGKKCPLDGLYDMRPCLYDAAVAFSFPHFLNGDSRLRHMVLGLR